MQPAGGQPVKECKQIKRSDNGDAWFFLAGYTDNYTTLPDQGELYKKEEKEIAVLNKSISHGGIFMPGQGESLNLARWAVYFSGNLQIA
jgi:hypothetical protein